MAIPKVHRFGTALLLELRDVKLDGIALKKLSGHQAK